MESPRKASTQKIKSRPFKRSSCICEHDMCVCGNAWTTAHIWRSVESVPSFTWILRRKLSHQACAPSPFTSPSHLDSLWHCLAFFSMLRSGQGFACGRPVLWYWPSCPAFFSINMKAVAKTKSLRLIKFQVSRHGSHL